MSLVYSTIYVKTHKGRLFNTILAGAIYKCADGMMLVPTVAKFGQYARHELRSNIVITANSQQRAVVVPWSQQSHCSHNSVIFTLVTR